MTLRKVNFAWKYRKPLWKYRKLLAHRYEIAAVAIAGMAIVLFVIRQHGVAEDPSQAAG